MGMVGVLDARWVGRLGGQASRRKLPRLARGCAVAAQVVVREEHRRHLLREGQAECARLVDQAARAWPHPHQQPHGQVLGALARVLAAVAQLCRKREHRRLLRIVCD